MRPIHAQVPVRAPESGRPRAMPRPLAPDRRSGDTAAGLDPRRLGMRPGHEQFLALTLADARRLLEERAVRGLQIRYRYDGADWWDTLMVLPEGWRLVRIRHEFAG